MKYNIVYTVKENTRITIYTHQDISLSEIIKILKKDLHIIEINIKESLNSNIK
jgi:hypothetical protein